MRSILLLTIAAIALTAAIAATAQAPAAPDPRQIFNDNCAACHQENGQGIEGAFPALAGDKFDDAQIAAVVSYIRTSWGNKASRVSAAEVAKLRIGEAAAPGKKPITAH